MKVFFYTKEEKQMPNTQTRVQTKTEIESPLYGYLIKTGQHKNLTYAEMYDAFDKVMNNQVSDVELAMLLQNLTNKGETIDELHAVVAVLLKHANKLSQSFSQAIDNCGTGGDKSGSFNISTTSAFVMAGAGATVAKHGNKSITSKTGSSDVLSELGLDLAYHHKDVEKQLNDIGISFLYAPQMHPKLGQIMRVRQDLGVPTLFNLIGPLINPVDIDYQYVGVYDSNKLETIARVLKRLGRKKAFVVTGSDSMDEANLLGENHVVELKEDGSIVRHIVTPEDFGLPSYKKDDLKGGDSLENKEILLSVLENRSTKAQKNTVLVNSALGLYISNHAESYKEGLDKAKESIETGKAKESLEQLIAFYK